MKNIKKVAILITALLVTALLSAATFFPCLVFADVQNVTVRYLVRIADTTFARKVETQVAVPVGANHTIDVNDVADVLGPLAYGCMQSYCDTYVYNAVDDVYDAVYYKAVYLNAKTEDGSHWCNYYLDINLSFYDAFHSVVGGTSSSAYDYFWNEVHASSAALNGISERDLYGYWGFIMIPDTCSFSSLWSDIFGSRTTFSGELKHFDFSCYIDPNAYSALLTAFGYDWILQAWNFIVDFFTDWNQHTASCFFLYVDSSEVTSVFVAENGADSIDDNSPLIFNDIEDLLVSEDFRTLIVVALCVFGGIVLLQIFLFAGRLLSMAFGRKNKETTLSLPASERRESKFRYKR